MPRPPSPIASAADQPALAPRLDGLIAVARALHGRGWMPATSGSVSVRLRDHDAPERLRMAITVSGRDKGDLTRNDFLVVTDVDNIFDTLADPRASSEALFEGRPRPSGETLVHRAVYEAVPGAQAVLHTHSMFNTLASQTVAPGEPLVLSGLELLKALGHWSDTDPLHVATVANAPHIPTLAVLVGDAARGDVAPGVLVSKHGLYAWGPDLARAQRHVEALEFLFEHLVRARSLGL